MKEKGISKSMYFYVGQEGFSRITSSYSEGSDNYAAFMKVYDKSKGNAYEAVMSTPAGKAIGSGFYPTDIQIASNSAGKLSVTLMWLKR